MADRTNAEEMPLSRPLDRRVTRRRALGALAGGLTLSPRFAAAVVQLDVSQGNFQPMPIGLPDFIGGTAGDGDTARGVTQIITANLRRCGLFAPIDPAAYIEKIASVDAVPRFPDWRAINAQALITGRGVGMMPRYLPSPSFAFDFALCTRPPITNVGSTPPSASTLAIKLVVVVLPCVPAIAMP